MAQPAYLPEWAITDVTLPNTGGANKIRPKTSLRETGFDKGQIPSAEELNWQLKNVYDWVVHFKESIEGIPTVDATPNNVPGVIVQRNAAGSFYATEVFATLRGDVRSTGTSTFNNVDINGGAMDGVIIGATNPKTGRFTTLDCSGWINGNVQGILQGNAATATAWQNNFTLSLVGDVQGSVTFRGNEGSATITTTLNNFDIKPFNRIVWTGDQETVSFTRQQLYEAAGWPSDTGFLEQFKLVFFLKDTGGSQDIATTTLPIHYITNIDQSFEVSIDYGDAGDYILQVNYSMATFTFTASHRGNLRAIYITA